MNDTSLLSRRKFGQIFLVSSLASLTGVPLVSAAIKTGSRPNHFIYGIDVIPGSRRLELKRLNLKTMKVITVQSPIPDVSIERNEIITTFTRFNNHTFAIATAQRNADGKSKAPTLITFDHNGDTESDVAKTRVAARSVAKPKKATFSKLKGGHKIDGIVKDAQGKLITLTRLTEDRQIQTYDDTFQQSKEADIPNSKLAPAIKNLCQTPEGKIYAASVEGHGHHAVSTTLWVFNPRQRSLGFQKIRKLSFRGELWSYGLRSIGCTADGKIYGLGAPPDIDQNQLYEIHPYSGKMTLMSEFDVVNIAA